MCTDSPHGAQGSPCEDCLGDRISRTAERANHDRTPPPLWVRQHTWRVRPAYVAMLRAVPLSA
jgi:hypothetical protein